MYFRGVLLIEIVIVVSVMANMHDTPKTYCGKRLTRTLSIFCKGQYNSMLDVPQPEERLDLQSTYTYNSSPLVGYQPDAASMRSKRRIRRQDDMWYVYHGIIDECCLKPCTTKVLLSYCRQQNYGA